MNVPLEAKGIPYPLTTNRAHQLLALRSQEIQLKSFIAKHPLKGELDSNTYNLYTSEFYQKLKDYNTLEDLEKIPNIPNYEQFISDYAAHNHQLKEILKGFEMESVN